MDKEVFVKVAQEKIDALEAYIDILKEERFENNRLEGYVSTKKDRIKQGKKKFLNQEELDKRLMQLDSKKAFLKRYKERNNIK